MEVVEHERVWKAATRRRADEGRRKAAYVELERRLDETELEFRRFVVAAELSDGRSGSAEVLKELRGRTGRHPVIERSVIILSIFQSSSLFIALSPVRCSSIVNEIPPSPFVSLLANQRREERNSSKLKAGPRRKAEPLEKLGQQSLMQMKAKSARMKREVDSLRVVFQTAETISSAF